MVVLGSDHLVSCPTEPKTGFGRNIGPGESLTVWPLEADLDRLPFPQTGREVLHTVVDPLGKPVAQPGVELSPRRVQTSANGFNLEPISFRAESRGEVLMRASYADKQGVAYSYSAPIVVQ